MPAKPKVFVTRQIPAIGLDRIKAECDAEVWPDPLPPPHDVLRAKVADRDGLVALLTDRIDGDLLDAALSARATIRLEPSASIPRAEIDGFVEGLDRFCRALRDGDVATLLAFAIPADMR